MPKNEDLVEKRILEAVEYAHGLEKKPILTKIAREFDIPYDRFKRRFHGRGPRHVPRPANLLLSPIQEKTLIQWCLLLNPLQCRPTARMIDRAANQILQRGADLNSEAIPHTSKNWVYSFQKRLPVEIITQKPIDKKRLDAENIGELSLWFDRLEEYVNPESKNYIRTENIYNFDGFILGQTKAQRVATTQPKKTQRGKGSVVKNTTTTVIEAISADGRVIPPLIIFAGQDYLERWFEFIPDDYAIITSESG